MANEGQKATATLEGLTLIMMGEGVEWPLREGVLPVIQNFHMAPADAIQFDGRTRPVTLEIIPTEGNPVKITNLWILNIQPGENKFISIVTVADRRWFWSYGHILRRYNMRRNVGVKRLIANNLELQDIGDRGPEVQYWRWSLDGNNKWVARNMIANLMNAIAQIELEYWDDTFKTKIDERIGKKITNLPIEDLVVDDQGDQAVERAKSYLPEAGVTVDYDGMVVFFSKASGDEEEIISKLLPEIFNQGHTDLVKNSIIRPKEIHVLFTREIEVRFDFVESVSAQSQTTVTDEPLGEDRLMENVLPLPDYNTDGLNGHPQPINGRVICQGTWITFDDAMRAWGNMPIRGPTKKLDHEILRRAFVPNMDLWAPLQLTGEEVDKNGTLSPWMARIAACERHYRTSFRLNRLWMDRFLSIRDYRLSTIDPQSGQRAPSMAYGDYCIIPSQRTGYRNYALGKKLFWGINKTGYPGERDPITGELTNPGINELDDTAIPGPGVVKIVDHDQGIVRVEYAMDLNRTYEMVLPSQVVFGSMPTADIIQRERVIAWNSFRPGFPSPQLSPSFRLCFIITAIPASPNTTAQLHRIVVKPNDVSSLIPPSSRNGLNDARGPIMEIRIGAGKEVARIRWSDTKQNEIERCFGMRLGEPDLSGLVLNDGPTGGKKGASLREIAKAEAAAIYASLVDRYEGSMTGYMNGDIHLSGWLTEIRHRYAPDGSTTTQLTMPTQIPKMSMLSFLNSAERTTLMRLVQP